MGDLIDRGREAGFVIGMRNHDQHARRNLVPWVLITLRGAIFRGADLGLFELPRGLCRSLRLRRSRGQQDHGNPAHTPAGQLSNSKLRAHSDLRKN